MSAPPSAPVARRRWRRLARGLCAGVVLALAVALLAYATRERWLAPALADLAARRLSRATGAEVRIGALGGDWIQTLELRQIAWRDARDGAALPELDVALARARWHPWRLLRGRADWLESVEVEGLAARARAGASGGAAGERKAFQLPAALPSARIEARDLALELPSGELTLRSARLEIDAPTGARQPARLSAQVAVWQPRAGAARSGSLESELEWSAPRLALSSLRLSGVERLRASWLDLAQIERGSVSWSAQVSAFGGAVASAGAWRDGALETDLELQGVELAPALELIAPTLEERPEGLIAATGRLRFEPAAAQPFSARFDGRATNLRWRSRNLDELSATGSLVGSVLSVSQLHVLRGTGSLTATDVELPLGRSAEETLRSARGALELRGTDLPAWLGPTTGSIAARVPPHALELGARLSAAGLELERGRLSTTGGALEVRPSSIAWGPPGALIEEARFDLDLGLEFTDLAPLGAVLALPGRWSGSLRGALALDGTWRALDGEVDLEGRGVTAGDFELGDVSAHALANAQRVLVEELRATGPVGELELAGTWSSSEERLTDARLRARLAAPERLVKSLIARGAIEIEAQAEGPLRDLEGRLEVHARDVELLALGGHEISSLDLKARLEPGRAVVEELALRGGESELHAAGALRHQRWSAPYAIELETLATRRGELELTLASPAEVALDGDTFDTGALSFAGSAGRLEVDLSGSAGDLALRLNASELDPMPLLAPLARRGFQADGIEGSASVDLVGGALRAEAALDVGRLVLAQGLPELSFSAHGTLQDGRAKLERFAFERAGMGRLSVTGEAPFDPLGQERFGPGPLALRGRFELDDLGQLPLDLSRDEVALTGRIGVGFDLTGEWAHAQGMLEIDGNDLALVSRSGTPLFGPATLSANVQASEGALHLSEVDLRAPSQLELTGDGSLGLSLSPGAWLSGDVGSLRSAPLNLELNLSAADLAFLARLTPGLRRVSGRVDGRFALEGTLGRPEPSGTLTVSDGALRLSSDVPPFQDLHAELALEGRRLRMPILAGEMGGAPLSASGSLDWSGAEPVVQLEVKGEEVLIVQQSSLRLRSDANLEVSGPFSALVAKGTLALRDGLYTKRVELFRREGAQRAAPGPPIQLFSFESGPLSTLRLDVAITSRDPFRVENNLVQGALRADLRLTGTGELPELTGALFVDPTRVQLPATTLETTSGTLVFGRDDPLMPVLDVRLETRVRGYDVALHATGPLDDPELELNSIPPMPSEDLLVLVLTGKPPDLIWDANTGEQAAQTVAFYVGKDLLSDWFGGESSGEASWLDRIEYRTGVDMTASGEETTEVMVRVAGSGRGRPGRTVWLRAENDAYDRVNYGVRLLFRLK
jgi:autotransporter translocation and assembly factor TamB